MKVNLIALLNQSADCIEKRRKDDGAYAFMLREVAENLKSVRAGDATLEEFADLYCLTTKKTEFPEAKA